MTEKQGHKWPKLYDRVGEGNVREIVRMRMDLLGVDATEVARRAGVSDRTVSGRHNCVSPTEMVENWLEYKTAFPFARVSNVLRAVGLRFELVEDPPREWPANRTKADRENRKLQEV